MLALDQLVECGGDLLVAAIRRVLVDNRSARGSVSDAVHQLPERCTVLRDDPGPCVAEIVEAEAGHARSGGCLDPLIAEVQAAQDAPARTTERTGRVLSIVSNERTGDAARRTSVFVGGSMTDIQAAKSAGVLCIAYVNKPGKQHDFEQSDAVAVITDMHELADALNARWDAQWYG